MILHICAKDAWPVPEYRVPSLAEVGFIHCSDPGTVHLPANRLYAGRTDLVLLEIDPTLLGVPVRWEPGDKTQPDGVWYPHVFGPIIPAAVVAVHEFAPGPDGRFQVPESISNR